MMPSDSQPSLDFQNRPIFVRLAQLMLLLGLIVRLTQYLYNRSLWLDESSLALNIIYRSFAGLLTPLDHDQAAPLGFLLLSKFGTLILGTGEQALRFFPFLAGISSLFLFYRITRPFLSPFGLFVAMAFFALSDRLIYYSNEVKQYSFDVFLALLLTWSAMQCLVKRNLLSYGILLIIGSLSIWFSHPSIFMLAAIGVILAFAVLCERNWKLLSVLSLAAMAWLVLFFLNYRLSLSETAQNPFLAQYWRHLFAPLPNSAQNLTWYIRQPEMIIRNCLFLIYPGLALFGMIIGAVELAQKRMRLFLILVLPLLFALFASLAHKYPFADRFLLFVVPPLLILLAHGIAFLSSLQRGHTYIGVVCACLLLLYPAIHGIILQAQPLEFEEIRPVLQHIRMNWKEGDQLYVYHQSQNPFNYYAPRFKFPAGSVRVGISSKKDVSKYAEDIAQYHGRVWLILTHVFRDYGIDEEKRYLETLDQRGKRLDEIQAFGAKAYLYDIP